MYEIAKSRFEVFVCEQKITEEQDFDDKDKLCHHVMLKEDSRVVAYSRIVPKGMAYDYTSIGRVLVLESHRKKGIAQEMMKACLKFIKENLHENTVVLSAQLYVKGMYEAVGFKVISEVYDEVNIPHVKMKIEL
jgi:ElaA protein